MIWVGTDDGNVQVTRDGGSTWTNVSKNLPGVPAGSWVPQVHASSYNEGEAFVVVNNYRRNDWTPWIFRTRDFGKTWERLVDDKKVNGYALCFIQDPVVPGLMFAGTEFGLYVSIDEGKNWTKWTNGYPTVSTYDLAIHPREQDLVIATFGRALWVLDDIRPLRELSRNTSTSAAKKLQVYPVPDAYLANLKEGAGTRFTGNAIYKGDNRPYGASISYFLKDLAKKEGSQSLPETDTVKIEILNSKGEVIRHLTQMGTKGVNRVYWELTRDGFRLPTMPKPKKEQAPNPGYYVVPGTYTVRVKYAGQTESATVKVLADPRQQVDMAGLEQWQSSALEFEKMASGITGSMDKLRDAKDRITLVDKLVEDQVKDTSALRLYTEKKKSVNAEIDSLMRMVVQAEDVQGIYEDPSQLINKLMSAAFYLDPAFGTPNPPVGAPPATYGLAMKKVKADADSFNNSVNPFVKGNWKQFEDLVKGLNLQVMQPITN